LDAAFAPVSPCWFASDRGTTNSWNEEADFPGLLVRFTCFVFRTWKRAKKYDLWAIMNRAWPPQLYIGRVESGLQKSRPTLWHRPPPFAASGVAFASQTAKDILVVREGREAKRRCSNFGRVRLEPTGRRPWVHVFWIRLSWNCWRAEGLSPAPALPATPRSGPEETLYLLSSLTWNTNNSVRLKRNPTNALHGRGYTLAILEMPLRRWQRGLVPRNSDEWIFVFPSGFDDSVP
jgi:hypothetical protein